MSKDNKSKFFIFAIITGIFGYLAGILTAPKSGKETREDIADKAGEVKSEGLKKLKEVEEELAAILGNVQQKAGNLSDKAKAEYVVALNSAKDAQTKAKAIIKAAKSGSAEDEDLNEAIKQTKVAIKSLSQFVKK